jgi:hypothetical protein
VTEWLGAGLQNLLQRFEPASDLSFLLIQKSQREVIFVLLPLYKSHLSWFSDIGLVKNQKDLIILFF